MNQKKVIGIALVALVFVAAYMFFDITQRKKGDDGPVSPNILYITQPVTSFSGIVDKIEGNAILVTNRYSLLQTKPITITVIPNQPPVIPTQKTVAVTYRVVVSDKTQITQPMSFINYLFKTITPAPAPKLTIKDIKVGSYISINSQMDLRTFEGSVFEATMINLPQKINMLNGTIVRLEGNTVILRAFPPVAINPLTSIGSSPASPPQEKEYTVKIGQDTEISHMIFATVTAPLSPEQTPIPPKAEQLSLADLKKDMQITVYTTEDVLTNMSLSALRIEPILLPPVVAPQLSAQPTP